VSRPIPERIAGDGLELRRLHPDDATALGIAVRESIEHLRPWMPWIANEPVTERQRRLMLTQWQRGWPEHGEAVFGVAESDAIAGTLGLRPRGQDTLEIGYWIHAAFTRRGIATRACSLLVELAFSWPDVEHVEIHHDKANVASGGVPRKLGFRLVAELDDPKLAPAEIGIDCTWRIDRDNWQNRAAAP
jgi:RimJ/RimL family protein N-acetyltransferase